MSTILTELVRKQAASSMLSVFGRTVDKVVEEMAHDLLREPEFRAQLQQLVRAAFTQALKELNEPAPPADEPPMPSHRFAQLDRIEQLMRESREKKKAPEP